MSILVRLPSGASGKILPMKRWQFWLGVLISVVFIWLALRGLRFDEFWTAIKQANYAWIIPGILIYFVGVLVRSWRWQYLLNPIKKIPMRVMFPTTIIGYMGNNIYPARAGEVLRAVILKRKEGVAISASLATIIVERIFDGVVMLGFVFINLPELAKLTSSSGFVGNIQQVAIIGTGVFLGALAIFLLAAMFPRRSEKIGSWFIERLIPQKYQKGILGLMYSFLEGLAALRSPINILMIFITTVIIWLLETVKYWFVMHAFNFQRVLLCPDADERHCQPGDDDPFGARVHWHLRRAGHRRADRLWRASFHGGGLHACAARGLVASHHTAWHLSPGPGRH